MIKLGTSIYNAIKRSRPILKDGSSCINPGQKLSLSNPYLLEVLPENELKSFSWIEGKKLSTVSRILDRADSAEVLKRYNALCAKYKVTGFNDSGVISSRDWTSHKSAKLLKAKTPPL